MRKYKKRLKDELAEVYCDACGANCSRSMGEIYSAEYAVLEASWGYWSRKDGESFHNDLCEDCFDKILGFIGSISQGIKLN